MILLRTWVSALPPARLGGRPGTWCLSCYCGSNSSEKGQPRQPLLQSQVRILRASLTKGPPGLPISTGCSPHPAPGLAPSLALSLPTLSGPFLGTLSQGQNEVLLLCPHL